MGHGKGATYRAQARPPPWQRRRQPPARRRDPRCQAEHGSHGRRPRAAGRGSGGADHKRSCQLSARRRGPCGRPEGIWKSLSSLLTRHQHPPAGEPVQSARCGSRRDQPHQALVLPSPASPCGRVLFLHCYFVQLNCPMSVVMCRRTVMSAHARCLAKCQQAEVAVTGKNILHKVCSYSICQ